LSWSRAGIQLNIIMRVNGEDGPTIGSAVVDANGNFAANVSLPRASGQREVVVTSIGSAFKYQAVLGLVGGQLGARASLK
jgi:hypothetical protein